MGDILIILVCVLFTFICVQIYSKYQIKKLTTKKNILEERTLEKIKLYKSLETLVGQKLDHLLASEEAVKHLSDGIVIVKDDKFIFANEGMTKITGYSNKELVSQPWKKFLCEIDKDKGINAREDDFSYTEEIDGSYQVINRWRKKDGEMATLWWSITPYDSNNVCYAICRDVSRHNGKKEKIETILENVLSKEYTVEIPFLGFKNDDSEDSEEVDVKEWQ